MYIVTIFRAIGQKSTYIGVVGGL